MLMQHTISSTLVKPILTVASLILGLSVVQSFALNIFYIYPYKPIWFVVAAVSIGLCYILLTRFVLPAFRDWSLVARCLVIILTTLLATTLASFSTPDWQWKIGPQESQPIDLFKGSSWGSAMRVFELHAVNDDKESAPSQATINLPKRIKGAADARLNFLLTQPEWSVINSETGQAFEGADGVMITFKTKRDGVWESVQQVALNLHNWPNQRRWNTFTVNIPSKSEDLMIEVLPGPPGKESNSWYDRVWIGAEPELKASKIYLLYNIVTLGWIILLLIAIIWLIAKPVLSKLPVWLDYAVNLENSDKRFKSISAYFIPKKLFKFFVASIALGAILMIPVASQVAPWYRAATTPVQIELEAPLDTQIGICWDEAGEECLPLKPYRSSFDEKTAHLWLGELPPSPSYHFSLSFRSPVEHIFLRRLSLLNTQELESPLYQRTSQSAEMWFIPEGIDVRYSNQAFELSVESTGRLLLPEIIKPETKPWLTLAFVWSFLVGSLVLLGAFSLPMLLASKQSIELAPVKFCGKTKLWCIALGLAATLHILIVANSPVLINHEDSLGYVKKALSLAALGTYDTSEFQFELNRLPGYPLLLAGFFKLTGYRLTMAPIFQGSLFCLSVLALAFTLRRWLHPSFAVMAAFIAMLSPVQIWASRYILSESTFATFATFTLAAFFAHLGAKKIGRKFWWLIIYAILATFTVFIRPNGIVLFAALIPVYLPKMIGLFLQDSGLLRKAKSAMQISLPYVLVAAIFLCAILAWSARNYVNREYWGHSDIVGVYNVETAMQSGFFSAGSLLEINYPSEFIWSIGKNNPNPITEPGVLLYTQYLRDKYNSQYKYNAWRLRKPMFHALSDNGVRPTNKTISQLDNMFSEIALQSNSRLPWQANFASRMRVGWWAIAWPNKLTFDRAFFKYNYRDSYYDALTPQEIMHSHILPVNNQAPVNSKLIYDIREASFFTNLFSKMAEQYYKGYSLLLLLGLLGSLYLFWSRCPALGAPFLIFLANLVLNVYLLGIRARFIHIFDVFLVFQLAISLSLLSDNFKRRVLFK